MSAHNCPDISRYWLPDEHYGPSWVCTTNHHKVKTIFWISIIQMVLSSIAFILSFFGQEQLTSISTKNIKDPESEITAIQTVPISRTEDVVVLKTERTKIATTIKHINKTYGPGINHILNILVPILAFSAIKLDNRRILEAYSCIIVLSLFVTLIFAIVSASISFTAVERRFGYFMAVWTGIMNIIGIAAVAAMNIACLVLAVQVIEN